MTQLELNENNTMEQPTGYKRWLIGIAISVAGLLSSVGYVTYATGQAAQQVQQSRQDIERLDRRQDGLATKEDVKRVEDKVDRLIDRELNRK
jgi:hypothetical protein